MIAAWAHLLADLHRIATNYGSTVPAEGKPWQRGRIEIRVKGGPRPSVVIQSERYRQRVIGWSWDLDCWV